MLDQPRTLKLAAERRYRLAFLSKPHMKPLAQYVKKLRRDWAYVPDFDPLDGGVHARILFLFEKPGPKTAPPNGSGFISRNNDDPSAHATFDFMMKAKIPRHQTITWNSIPGWNGNIAIEKDEVKKGLLCLRDFLSLLPKLKVAVLVGKKAQKARTLFDELGIPVITSAHPSARVRASYPNLWKAIPREWKRVHKYL